MASGERFNPEDAAICAHRWLPFGTRVRLTHLVTNESIDVVVQDRGLYVDMEKRHFDISHAAVKKLQIVDEGVVQCRIEILETEE